MKPAAPVTNILRIVTLPSVIFPWSVVGQTLRGDYSSAFTFFCALHKSLITRDISRAATTRSAASPTSAHRRTDPIRCSTVVIGSATRTSHTVGIPFLYVAAPIQGGAVRLAYPLSSIQQTTRTIRLHLLWASLAALT